MKPGKLLRASLTVLLWSACAIAQAAEVLDLSGAWQFALDREDQGVAQGWHGRSLPDSIGQPGILNAQGDGDEIGARTPWIWSPYDKHWRQQQALKRSSA